MAKFKVVLSEVQIRELVGEAFVVGPNDVAITVTTDGQVEVAVFLPDDRLAAVREPALPSPSLAEVLAGGNLTKAGR